MIGVHLMRYTNGDILFFGRPAEPFGGKVIALSVVALACLLDASASLLYCQGCTFAAMSIAVVGRRIFLYYVGH